MNATRTRVVALSPNEAEYPESLRRDLRGDAPTTLAVVGDPGLLRTEPVALITSMASPPDLLLPGFDLIRTLRGERLPVLGGFQTPIERLWLRLLLRGTQPVIVCMARSVEGMSLPRSWLKALDEERLALLSGAGAGVRRPTVRSALARNRIIVAIGNRLFAPYARSGSRAFRTAAFALELGREVYCFDHPANADLALIGAARLPPDRLITALRRASPASRS